MYKSLKANTSYTVSARISYPNNLPSVTRNPLWHFDQLYPQSCQTTFPPPLPVQNRRWSSIRPDFCSVFAWSLSCKKPYPPVFLIGSIEVVHFISSYCWWKTSWITWHVWNPVNKRVFTISIGAGFFPSTVRSCQYLQRKRTKRYTKFFSKLIYPKRCWQGCCENVSLAYPPEDGDWFLRCTECIKNTCCKDLKPWKSDEQMPLVEALHPEHKWC